MQPSIVRVLIRTGRIDRGTRHPEGLGQHESFNERFNRVRVGLCELDGQVIEQFRMTRPLAQPAEVVRRGYDPATEELVPDPVDYYPGGKWMILFRKLPGEL